MTVHAGSRKAYAKRSTDDADEKLAHRVTSAPGADRCASRESRFAFICVICDICEPLCLCFSCGRLRGSAYGLHNRAIDPRGARVLTDVLSTVCDFIRYATSRFNAAGVFSGHGFDNALDEASFLVLTALHLPHDLPPAYASANLLPDERRRVLELIRRRADERVPSAYLVGEAWFAGLAFKVTPDVLIPRSPIAEMIEQGFEPWLGGRACDQVLDLCTGSGCIGIAIAAHFPEAAVDLVDLSPPALALAAENAKAHGVDDRVRTWLSDGFDALKGRRYDLIVTNPPYVGAEEYASLPAEYAHEPAMGLQSGADGLDLPLRILAQAPEYLSQSGLLVLEVGASQSALVELLPEVPFTWVEFERGGSGVAVIERADLVTARAAVKAALRRRGVSP